VYLEALLTVTEPQPRQPGRLVLSSSESKVALVGSDSNFSELSRELRDKKIDFSKHVDGHSRLVFVDLSLGFDIVASKIRSFRGFGNPPVVVGFAPWTMLDIADPALTLAVDDVFFYPCQPGELKFRLERLLKTALEQRIPIRSTTIEFAGFKFNAGDHAVVFKNTSVKMTKREFELMLFLAEKANQVISRATIETQVWQHKAHLDSFDNVLNVHLTRLRRKLRELGCDALLVIDRGAGISLKSA
jgi:DNA-binding response OmpR family regulator